MTDLQTRPHDASARWALTPRASMRYVRSGGHGRPVLLLHEMGGSLESWNPVLDLMPPDQQVLRCDMRGAGGSEKIRAETDCNELADDVVALLDHLGIREPIDVAGCAIGGCLALTLAARHPGRVHRLAPINPPTDAEGRSGEALRERALLTDAKGMRGVVESALARSYPDIFRVDRATYEAYVARFLTNDPTSYAFILRALVKVDFTGILETIDCPTLFIAGEHDRVRTPTATAAVAPRVKGSRFREIEGGHIPSVQAPAAVAEVLGDFFGW